MRQTLLGVLWLLVLESVACESNPVMPTTSPLSPVASPLLTATPQAATTPTPKATPSPAPWPTSAATALPTLVPTSEGIAPPPGLVYRNESGIWRVEADGQSSRLFQRYYGVALSADGTYALYFDGNPSFDQVWLINLLTNQRRNLVEGLDRIFCCPSQWPSRSEWITLGSYPRDNAGGPNAGYLTAVQLDGRNQHVLEPNTISYGASAISPDGQTVAYDRTGTAWLYQRDSEPQPFDPKSYGLSNVAGIASPAWSPNGKQLAWQITGNFDGKQRVGVGVFDLEKHTARILFPYEPSGPGEGWLPAPTWSADSQWLAYFAQSDAPLGGLWVVRPDGKQKHALEDIRVIEWAWSPRGHQLIVSQIDGQETVAWLINVDSWHRQRVSLPVDARIFDWVSLPK